MKEITVKFFNAAFFLALLVWLLEDIWKRRRESEVTQRERHQQSTVFNKITVLLNFVIAISYLGYSFYEFWRLRTFTIDLVFTFLTWALACVIAVYSLSRSLPEQKRWPYVLILWWLFSSIFLIVSVSLYFLDKFNYLVLPKFLPKINVIDIASFPLLIMLCFNALHNNSAKEHTDSEQPFLEKEKDCQCAQEDAFSTAGIWSKLTFIWLNPLFKTGHLEKLELHHIPTIPRPETAAEAFSSLEESLCNQNIKKASFLSALLRPIWGSLVLNAAFAGANTIASYIGPLLITSFVNFLSEKDVVSNWHQGLILAFIFFLAQTVESMSQRQWYFGAYRIGIRLRAALMVLIYKKSVSTKYGGMSTGKIINLINVDIERIGDFCSHVHGIWLLPVQVILALIILYRNLGAAPSFAALFTTIFVMVSNTPLVKVQKQLHTKIMEAKDSRIRATSEILKSMKVLKLHSWESTFSRRLLQLRETERSWVKKYLYTCSTVAFLFWASPTLISVVTFGVCIILKAPLSSKTVLSTLATFRILQEPIYNLPELISMISQAKVSVDRIQNFITRVDDDEDIPIGDPAPSAYGIAVEIEAAEYAWKANDSKNPTIMITEGIRITKGQKVVICGSVGSGKSSLLYSILGEIPRISGASIKTFGTKAYVPQSAWIQTGTIKDNVLFGKEMEKAFYEDVIRGCALNRDIEMWLDGDLSIVGERGLNLSGGQKQRIQLARAIYCNSDILLLDDPFSAVDMHTGTHIFKECLQKLLDTKTVIYVTHQLEFLDTADLVLVMKDGKIVQSGKYRDLISDPEGELIQQMAAHKKTLGQLTIPQQCNRLLKGYHQDNQTEITGEKFENCNMSSRALQQEETESGRVKWHVYSTFITSAFKGTLVPLILLCQILFQGLQMASNYWIAWGTNGAGRVSSEKLIGIFMSLSAGSSLFILGRAFLLSTIAIETSQRLFLGMTTSVFRATLSFFDSTPSSRILSRYSTDQSIVDTDIPYRLAGLAFALIQLLSIIVLMSQVAWQVFFLFLIVLAISIWYQAYYITTARELARMVGIQKAPILHHLSESITGAATIRCFNQENRFLKRNLDLIDDYSRVAFYNSATMEWLYVRINFLFNLVFFFLLIILVNIPRSAIDPSLAGLAATYGLNLNVIQAWVIWNLCNVENKMISVERILQFTNIPSEAPLVIENCKPHSEWPLSGRIEIDNLHVQYSPSLPRVLKGITCIFPAKNKIGIAGRTGSGKSTLIQALFRVLEPSDGRILIDGLDICKIGLQDLRSKLSIIPQDPTLFQGTIRSNLDPLQQYSDHDIWEVLHKCHLAEIVKQDQRLIDAPVAEDGANWSVGQRQLVCLARALLQKRRVLVLDEATASVDTVTDNVIQKTIREETSRCTVLTVAHRITTVIDNDLVLVLGEGKVIEYDTPAQLLEDGSSAFSNLVTEFLRRSSQG